MEDSKSFEGRRKFLKTLAVGTATTIVASKLVSAQAVEANASAYSNPSGTNPAESFDFLVVGGGAAGCVVASYIAENTKASVALLEAGKSDWDPLIHMPAGSAKILEYEWHVWKDSTTPQFGTVMPYLSGKVLGGGSSINAMCYVRGQRRDYDEWQTAVGNTGKWSFDDLLPHFIAQEKNDTFHDQYHGIDGGLAVTVADNINELNKRCMKAFQEYGLPYNADYNGASQIGVSPVHRTIGDNKRCSAADAYLRPHIESGRVKLFTECTVTKVLMEGGKAIGVEYVEGDVFKKLFANATILSAGATHSPKILMHSGVGPADHLKAFGIKVLVDSPEVGENLVDHPVTPVVSYVKGDMGYQSLTRGAGMIGAGMRYVFMGDGPVASNGIETVSHWNPNDFSAEPTIQCYHIPLIEAQMGGYRSGLTLDMIVLRPKSKGWLRLADKDPLSMPLINPNFLTHPDDLKAMVGAIKEARKVFTQPSLRDLMEEEYTPGSQVKTDAELGEWARKSAQTMWHPVGTCRMGNDSRAVVDARLRVNGVENLRVIDASIMPNIVSANTNAPVQALARHAAQILVEDYR
ncbi:GMC family oxidoreductase N-terminal domain-containing protein [Pseudomonas rustica]